MKNEKGTKTCIIPNGVNIGDYFKHEHSDGEIKTIISVGALTAFKRHYLTIQAVSMMNATHLIIVGKGEEQKELKALADKMLPGRYEILSVSYAEIKNMYNKADLFVLPSLEEPFGIVYLEAMASNIPIVAPDDSQRREIIGTAGLYCNVEDIKEYKETMEKALLINWGNRPFEQAQKYDWEIVASKYKNLIDDVLMEYDQYH